MSTSTVISGPMQLIEVALLHLYQSVSLLKRNTHIGLHKHRNAKLVV